MVLRDGDGTVYEDRRKPGQLGPFVEGYRSRLLSLGYTPGTVGGQLKVLGQLGRWMQVAGLDAADLNEARIEQFLSVRRGEDHPRVPGMRSFGALLEYLRDEHVVPAAIVPVPTALEEFVGVYRDWLVTERGLAPPTVLRYENLARRFLREHSISTGEVNVQGLTGADVSGFVLAERDRVSLGAVKGRAGELRSLLRFLHLRGLIPVALATAVPAIAGWRDAAIPKTMTAPEVQALIDSCDRTRPEGARDYAILVTVARLGLRSAEVSRLQLGDVDWRAGELLIRGKTRRQDRLPLPVEVGEALAEYLRDARPDTEERTMFMTCRPPRHGIRPDLVKSVVHRACQRCGVTPVGAHRLRHALATEMLSRGASLVTISQVLRHQDLATTAIYAKVDIGRLRTIAQPWPGARR